LTVRPFVDTYSEVTASVDEITTAEQLHAFIRQILRAYELKNGVYYLPGMTGEVEIKPFYFVTWSQDWFHRYIEADYLMVDPVVTEGFGGLLPIDWSTLDRRAPRVKQMFGESLEFGVGRQGLTFPIRGPKGESALFSVTSDLPDKEWAEAKRTYIRDLQILAHTIHAKAMTISGAPETEYRKRLTPRERECLTWCAAGKTSDDIATILRISEGVVRIHLRSAQQKLGCLNRTHTVAKAMTHKLIFPDYR
jgi:LuxR family transcriptional regulator, quorum-sensing system regulator RaiR